MNTLQDIKNFQRTEERVATRVHWVGNYSELSEDYTIQKNDLLLSDGYLLLSNKATEESPLPILNGDPFSLQGGNYSPSTQISNSVITSGNVYTINSKSIINKILVYPTTVAANWSYRLIITNLSNNNEEIRDLSGLVSGQWNSVDIASGVYSIGTQIRVVLETTHSAGSATYNEQFNFWSTYPPPSSVSVSPFLEFGGIAESPEAETAMGVDVEFQDVTLSEDYDILSYTNFSGDGGGAGAVESVNGQVGAVSLGLNDINDVSAPSPSDGDIVVYRSASGQFVLEQKPAAGTNPAWGDITGTLSSQTDLQSALNLKANTGDLSDVAISGSYADLTNKPTTITVQQASDITDNNSKISYTDATQVATNTSDISSLQSSQSTQDTAIALNTAKTGITAQQASDITSNNAKVSDIYHPLVETAVPLGAVFTDTVYDDTAIQAEVDLNTAKVGITTAQSNAIVANTNKVSYTDATQVADNASDISTIQADQATQDAAIALNTAKVGISTTQAADIVSNNAKVSNVSHPLVETAVPVGAVFTDTIYNDSDVVKDSDVLTPISVSNKVVTQSDVASLGGGDMLASVYDTNSSNVVDDSEKLNNQSASYYLNYNNFTNKPTTITAQQASDIATNNGKISYTDSAAVAANTAKVGITPAQAADITSNNAKISYTDAAQVATNTGDISTIQGEQSVQDGLISANTAKVGITTTQANDIVSNNAKNSYPSADASKLSGIEAGAEVNVKSDWNATSGDAEILNKPDTITDAQAIAIVDNTAKRSYPLADENRLANTSGTNTGDQDISGIATNASDISNLEFDVSSNSSDITTNGGNIASNASAIVTNAINIASATQRANHTGTQLASTISDFDSASNAVIGGFDTVNDGYEVSESDNNSVLSYDSTSDGNIILDENSSSAVSIGFRCKVIQVNDGLITFQTSGASTIKSLNGAIETTGEGSMVDVVKISTNGWLISGDLA